MTTQPSQPGLENTAALKRCTLHHHCLIEYGFAPVFHYRGCGGKTEDLRRPDTIVQTTRGPSFLERLRRFHPPHHLGFHSAERTVFTRLLPHSCPRRMGVHCPSGHYATPYPSRAGQVDALRATLVYHASPPTPRTNSWRDCPFLPRPLPSHRLHSRRPFYGRHLPSSICLHRGNFAFDHPRPSRGQPGESVRCSSFYRELHGQYAFRDDFLSYTEIFFSDGRQFHFLTPPTSSQANSLRPPLLR